MAPARSLAVSLLAATLEVSAFAASRPLVTVSPGGVDSALTVAVACPTFSWGAAEANSLGFELAIYRVDEDGSLAAAPTLRTQLPRGATSWTPSADRCLGAGRYAWTVRGVGSKGEESAWAAPRLFRVEDDALAGALERAVERVLERFIADGRIAGASPSSGPGEVRPQNPALAAPQEIERAAEQEGASEGQPSFVADTSLYDPPDCQDGFELFTDVESTHPLCEFIEQFANDQISTGCTSGRFCPDDPVSRGQLAVYIERAMRGTDTWLVNADSLDNLDSTAFLQRSGGAMTGTIDMQNNLLANIGVAGTDFVAGGGLNLAGALTTTGNATLGDSVADTLTVPSTILGASPLIFEGSAVDGNEATFAITNPTVDRTITFPDAGGQVSLLGPTISSSEVDDLDRSVSLPITSFVNCTTPAPIDFTSADDAAPDFSLTGPLHLVWDVSATADVDEVCTMFVLPSEFVSSDTIAISLLTRGGASHDNDWEVRCNLTKPHFIGGTTCSVPVNGDNCDAAQDNNEFYACGVDLTAAVGFSPGNFIELSVRRSGGSDSMSLYGVRVTYAATQ